MSDFYERLKAYYEKVAAVLRDEADAASMFPNSTDKGMARERVYLEFLRTHLPAACKVKFGGFLFSQDGQESQQIDVIVTSDECPQFDFHNRDGQGKSFACIDGTLAVASLKSNLDGTKLREALDNIASIPQHTDLWEKCRVTVPYYREWPYKIIYAPRGASVDTLLNAIREYYTANPVIPKNRWPALIHVAGGCCIRRCYRDLTYHGTIIKAGQFFAMTVDSDVSSLAMVVDRIQQTLIASRQVPYYFGDVIYRMFGVSEDTISSPKRLHDDLW